MRNNIAKGIEGEDRAVKYLISKGYDILDRNYRIKTGEIDIIATKSDILVFIEVKARTSINFGYPYEAVNWKKRNTILKTSLAYMQDQKLKDYQARYDVIEVYLGKESKINHIKNAF
ncbi:MAG TPA: YraN family protein [Tepidimicrobium sp.]|nr:YraN family protein [Tepidimicrobium sp.]